MKVFLLLFLFLISSCINKKHEIPNKILKKNDFITILKDVHLAEAEFEINKPNDLKNAENILANEYLEIYSKYNTNKDHFEKTLSYYTKHPEELEIIYSKVLIKLSKEKDSLIQK